MFDFNSEEIAIEFLKTIHDVGHCSISDCYEKLKEKEEFLPTEFNEDNSIALKMEIENVLRYLLDYWENSGRRNRRPNAVVEPSNLSKKQSEILMEWIETGENENWDLTEFNILDNIKWVFRNDWVDRFEEIEIPMRLEF